MSNSLFYICKDQKNHQYTVAIIIWLIVYNVKAIDASDIFLMSTVSASILSSLLSIVSSSNSYVYLPRATRLKRLIFQKHSKVYLMCSVYFLLKFCGQLKFCAFFSSQKCSPSLFEKDTSSIIRKDKN